MLLLLFYVIYIIITGGVFPDIQKLAFVIPVHKNGSKEICNNYRPISLLSPFAKISENCLYNQLNNICSSFQLLNKQQFGFRQNHDTSLAVPRICNEMVQCLDQWFPNVFEPLPKSRKRLCLTYLHISQWSLIVVLVPHYPSKDRILLPGVIYLQFGNHWFGWRKDSLLSFLDLAKAFDNVDHTIVLSKLERSGVRGLPLQLIKSYLTNRYQRRVVDGLKSNEKVATCGVPQEATPGSFLLIIYTMTWLWQVNSMTACLLMTPT